MNKRNQKTFIEKLEPRVLFNGVDAQASWLKVEQIEHADALFQIMPENQTLVVVPDVSSRDPNLPAIVRFDWDTDGDGTFESAGNDPQAWHDAPNDAQIFHDAPGDYTIGLRATDADGNIATTYRPLHVTSRQVQLRNTDDMTLATGKTWSVGFSDLRLNRDPMEDKYVIEWDTDYDGTHFTPDKHGDSITANAKQGTHHIAVRLTDDDGRVDLREFNVTGIGAEPVDSTTHDVTPLPDVVKVRKGSRRRTTEIIEIDDLPTIDSNKVRISVWISQPIHAGSIDSAESQLKRDDLMSSAS